VFFKGLGYVIFFWDGDYLKGLFFGWHGREKFFRWDLKKNLKNYFFGGVGWGVWRKQMGFLFFFFSFVIW